MVIFLTMEYTFEGCPHHNICLYNELNIQIGFEECIDIRRKVKAFEATNKDRISVFHPYILRQFVQGVWRKDSDMDRLIETM